jgi:hypothetical protein
MAEYIGRTGALYRGATVEARAADAARLILETSRWTRDRWEATALAATDMAFEHYASRDVVERMVASWRARLPLAWQPAGGSDRL